MDKSKINEMVKALQDAHMYEDNMTEQDMQEIYKVISDSKDTAKEEARKNYESDEDMFEEELSTKPATSIKEEDIQNASNNEKEENKSAFKPKTWTFDKKRLDTEIISAEEDKEENAPKDATKFHIGFEDMAKTKEPLLNIIYHSKQFTNIQNSQKFLKADTTTKAMMLHSYHTNMERLRSKLARQSFCTVPLPKPIVLREQVIPSLDREIDLEDTYISRSGRQTKRKCYYTDEENVLETNTTPSNKKQKAKNDDEQDWISKTKSGSKTVAKKLELTPKVDSQKPMEIESSEEEKKVVQKTEQKEVARPRSKKLTSTEIMNKSSLFLDSPKRRTPRSELLFDKLVEDNAKKEKEDKAMEKFENSLMDTDDSLSDSQKDDDIITVDKEPEPVRRRVIPPIPTRRAPIGNRNKQQQGHKAPPLSITVESASTSVQKEKVNSSDELMNRIVSSRTRQKDTSCVKENGVSVSSSTSVGSSTDVCCPICAKLFSKDSIQEHASSCGEEQIVTRYTSHLSSKPRSCELCDKVIFDDYNLHVQECLQKQKSNDKRK